ncbi:MAG: hypothetical protein U1E27_12005, partial [Kiritimatiellia bacterium]|nr:hypothetical protein [Kiritimatiellia bacterium]
IGDVVEGFTITEYRKEQDTLVLTRGERVVPLKRGVDVQDSDITVRFAFLIDRTQPESRVGHTFKLREAEYRLLEATRDGAKIMNLEGNVTHEIGPMSDAERRLMSGPGGMNILLPGALPEPARPGGANTFPVP